MITLAESLVSSTSRPVKLRMRPDLEARRQRYQGQAFWVVKEPVGLNYFRFHEEEYAILQMLDGHTSLETVKERFEEDFTPQKITFQDLQQFIGMLHRSGLVISEASGQGRQLKKRRDQKVTKERLGKLANIFALRFRGIDPDWILNAVHKYTWWFFTPAFMMIWLLIAASAGTLVLVEFDVFRARLPAFQDFFAPHNWFYLAVTMGVVKVLHEFGHGLSCKHYGGECHEMGAMLLVFTPALYCNVSDSWMLPNKWHRAFIGAAGMYVEVFLASIATFVWWFSEPGFVNQVALSVMFICSVSTVMFNGNPLLRFDGYYILMDLLEIPNLRQKSTEVLRRFLFEKCLGVEQPENPFLPQKYKFFFGMFTVAAVVYRWLVVFSILMFMNAVLKPYGLEVIGRMIALTGFIGLVVQPVMELAKFFYIPGRMNKMKRHRVITSGLALAALVLGVLFVPLPHYVRCSFEIAPRDAASIYAETNGRITLCNVRVGDQIQGANTVIMELESLPLEAEVVGLEGKRNEARVELASLRERRFTDRTAELQIASATEVLGMIEEQLTEKKSQLARTKITSPISGTVLAAPFRSGKQGGDGRLPMWSGNVLDERNRSAVLSEGDQICFVGNPDRLEAVLVIDQVDFNLVHDGDPVMLKLESYQGKAIATKIDERSMTDMKVMPTSLAAQVGGGVQTKMDGAGNPVPMSTSYQARAFIDDKDGELRMGMRGKARIFVG
ncbi:MAG TPA: hemolysin D, partial [Pirellulaceae bacterium]|nr:hemolysin D [Pirellulaceae bacterium]